MLGRTQNDGNVGKTSCSGRPEKETKGSYREAERGACQAGRGKDILVSQYCDFWWYSSLKLNRLKVDWSLSGKELPSIVVLKGTHGASIRIFLERFYQLREQYHDGNKPYYLLDFWNGFRESPIDKYKHGGYQCLHIES